MEEAMRRRLREILKQVIVMVIFICSTQLSIAMECKNVGSRCVDKSEKVVDGFKVTKCWKFEDSFECKYPSKDNCKPLREEGCLHVTHDAQGVEVDGCLKEHQGKCLNYKKNYVCYREKEIEEEKERIKLKYKTTKKKIKCTSNIECMDGSCGADDEEEAKKIAKENSEDMMNAITQMTALNDMAKDFSQDNVSVFKGEAMRCKKNPILSFRDCCGAKGSGWGTSIGLARCDADSKAMYERDQAGHCIDLGTYCSEEWPIIGCVAREHTYCCFGGKLQKIIHEQGRAGQLGIGFGSAENPNCRGITIEEMQKLNFDKIKFDNFYDEVMKKYKTPNVKESSKRVSDAFANIARDFQNGTQTDSNLKDKTNQIPFRNKKFNEEVKDEDTGITGNRPHM